ncbi:hypothetical protein [Planctomicrobium sp. SH664]|uniref:hypothetical protein n=1 Tax=Planctomicrobium sp. SH664 TaxID=3448125 RepID=UPI003F5B6178
MVNPFLKLLSLLLTGSLCGLAVAVDVCAQEPRLLPSAGKGIEIFHADPEPFIVLPAGFEVESDRRSTAVTVPTQSLQTGDLRARLKESLSREGQSSLQQRDSLTDDAARISKWTIALLLVVGTGLFTMRRLGLQPVTQSAVGSLRIQETLKFGRAGLHLVSVGSERLIVAADQGGIRSVTLLPSWPGHEGDFESLAAQAELNPVSRTSG